MITLSIQIASQSMQVFENKKCIREYIISTGKNGSGELINSGQTPRGWHIIRAKIGANCKVNTVFVGRRPTGEIYSPQLCEQFPNRDWIITRILWLSGLEKGKNRLGEVDTLRRFIYIHGSPDEVKMGIPGSRGCIRMHNDHIVELFDLVSVGTVVLIS